LGSAQRQDPRTPRSSWLSRSGRWRDAGDQVLDREGAGWTLHRLRHWLLTHEAESGTGTD